MIPSTSSLTSSDALASSRFVQAFDDQSTTFDGLGYSDVDAFGFNFNIDRPFGLDGMSRVMSSQHLETIGDKEKALEHLKLTESKTVADGLVANRDFETIPANGFPSDTHLDSFLGQAWFSDGACMHTGTTDQSLGCLKK